MVQGTWRDRRGIHTHKHCMLAPEGQKLTRLRPTFFLCPHPLVAVAILCCSVCFTDTMYAAMIEGQVVGHEIIGRVEFKGEDVTNVENGDTIGFGYLRTACLECLFCLQGQENMCPKRTTFTDGIGGFANASVWDSRFVYKIPSCIEPRHAGPLTCAGATVFSALYGYNVSPTSTVGVVGLGGLGHMAIKFAKAWGCKGRLSVLVIFSCYFVSLLLKRVVRTTGVRCTKMDPQSAGTTCSVTQKPHFAAHSRRHSPSSGKTEKKKTSPWTIVASAETPFAL